MIWERRQGELEVFEWLQVHVIASKLETRIEHLELVSDPNINGLSCSFTFYVAWDRYDFVFIRALGQQIYSKSAILSHCFNHIYWSVFASVTDPSHYMSVRFLVCIFSIYSFPLCVCVCVLVGVRQYRMFYFAKENMSILDMLISFVSEVLIILQIRFSEVRNINIRPIYHWNYMEC